MAGAGLEPVSGGVNVVRQGGKGETLWCVVSCHLMRGKDQEGLLNEFGINMGGNSGSGTQGCRAFEMPGVKNNEVEFISLVVATDMVRSFLGATSTGVTDFPNACDPIPCTYEPADFNWSKTEARDRQDFYFIQESGAGGGRFRFKIHLDAFVSGIPGAPSAGWNQPDHECDKVPDSAWLTKPTSYHDTAWIEAPLESYDLYMTFEPCERTTGVIDPGDPGGGGAQPGDDSRNKLVKDWFLNNCFSIPDTFCKKHCHDNSKDCEPDQGCSNNPGQWHTLIFNLIWNGFGFDQPESGLKVGMWCATSVNVSKTPTGTPHILTKGINYFEGISSGLKCDSTSCTTGEPFRKYLYDLMCRELAAGGFPYIVPGSFLPSQAILVGGAEIFNGYTLSGRYVEREELMSETITRLGFNKKIKIKPKLDPKLNVDGKAAQIGFAVDGKRREAYVRNTKGKLVKQEPNLKKRDVWTATVFGSFTATETWEMVNIWKQTIEASVYCPSGGGRCCEREQDQITGKWKLKKDFVRPKDCSRPYKEIVGPAGAPVFFTAHELALEKTFIAKYSSMAANLGVNIENKYISFQAAIATSYSDKPDDADYAGADEDDTGSLSDDIFGTFHMNARIQIKKLLSLINDGRWGGKEIKDSLTMTLPTYSFGSAVDNSSLDKNGNKIPGGTIPSFAFTDIKISYGIQIENNLSISISGFTPFDLWTYEPDPDDPTKKIKTLKPISASIKYQLEDSKMLTIDIDTDGNWALGLAIEWERADFKNEWVGRMMDNTVMQMGLSWDQQKGKEGGFKPSWTLNKAFGDVFSTQWDILRGKFKVSANLLSRDFGDVKHGLGKVNVGITASWREFDLYKAFFDEKDDDGALANHDGSLKAADIVGKTLGKLTSKGKQETGKLTDKEKGFTWGQLMPKLRGTLEHEKEFYQSASIFGDIMMKSSFGAMLGNTSGTLNGWSFSSKGITVIELKNRALQFLGLGLNVHPHLANGFHFLVGNRESEYFGSKWGGFEFSASLGLFGYRFAKVTRHDAILGILDKRRYPSSFNFGFLPWGKIEDDGDYVARTFPCLMHNIAKFCEENWYENLIDTVKEGGNVALSADCDYLKDYYYPLNKQYWQEGGQFSKKMRTNIAMFYGQNMRKELGGSKIAQKKRKVQRLNEENELEWVTITVPTWVVDKTASSKEQQCNRKKFDKWEPVVATRKYWPNFPYDIPADIESMGPEALGAEYQGSFRDQPVKSFLYYVREIHLFYKQEGCTDEMPTNWKAALKSQTGYGEAIGTVEAGQDTKSGEAPGGMHKKDGVKDEVRFPLSKKVVNILDWSIDNSPKNQPPPDHWCAGDQNQDVLYGRDVPQFCRTEKGRVKERPCLKQARLRWAGWYKSKANVVVMGPGDPGHLEDRIYTMRQRYINKYIEENKNKEVRSLFKRQSNVATELMKERMNNLNVENSFTDNFARLYWLTAADKTRPRYPKDPAATYEANSSSNDFYREEGRQKFFDKMGITTVADRTYKQVEVDGKMQWPEKIADQGGEVDADVRYHMDDEYGNFPCAMNNKKGTIDSILDTPLGFPIDLGKSVIEMFTFGKYFSKKRKLFDGAVDQYYSDGRFGLMKATWNRDAPFGSINLWENQDPPAIGAWRAFGNFLGVTHDQDRWCLIMLGHEGSGGMNHMDVYHNGSVKVDPPGIGSGHWELSGNYEGIWKEWEAKRVPQNKRKHGWEMTDGKFHVPYIDYGVLQTGGVFDRDPVSKLRGGISMKQQGGGMIFESPLWNKHFPTAGIIIRIGKFYLAVADYRYYYYPYDPNSTLSKLNREFRRKVRLCLNPDDPRFTDNFLHLTVEEDTVEYPRTPILGNISHHLRKKGVESLGQTYVGNINTRRGWEFKENKSMSAPAGGAGSTRATLMGKTVLVYPAESDPGIQCSKWYNNFFYSDTASGFYNTIGYYMLPDGNKHTGSTHRRDSERAKGYIDSVNGIGATIKNNAGKPSWVTPVCADWIKGSGREPNKYLLIGIDGLIWSKKASMKASGWTWSDFRHIARKCCCAISINPNPSENEGFLNTLQNKFKFPFTDLRIFPDTDMRGIGRLFFWKWHWYEEKIVTPGFCAMPWKGNPDSCHLSFYRFMHEIWLRYMSLFMSEWGSQSQDASDIDAFCRAKVTVVRYCGYNKTDTEDIVLWDSTYAMYNCISGTQEHLPIPDYISDTGGIPCAPMNDEDDKLKTTSTPAKYFASQTLNNNMEDDGEGEWQYQEGTTFHLGCRFVEDNAKRLNHTIIGEVVDIRDFLRVRDKLDFIDMGHCNRVDVVFKDLWGKYKYIFERFQYIKLKLDDALLALRDELALKFVDPTGTSSGTEVRNGKKFVGNYCDGDAVTNLEEIMTLKKKVEFHASGAFAYIQNSALGTTFSSKLDNDENIIWLGSKALTVVSDPFDGYRYSDRVITHAGIQHPMGRNQMFGTTFKMSEHMNKAWAATKAAYDGVGWTFPFGRVVNSQISGDIVDHWSAGRNTWNPCQPSASLEDMLGPKKPVAWNKWGEPKAAAHKTHLVNAWVNYTKTFEHFYPILIDSAKETLRERVDGIKTNFYGMLENDLRAVHLINMRLFCPWVEVAIDIGAKMKEGDLELGKGLEMLYDFLYPIFIDNYPGGWRGADCGDPAGEFGCQFYGAKEMEMKYLWKPLDPKTPAFVQSYYKGIGKTGKGGKHGRNKIIDAALKGKIGVTVGADGKPTHPLWENVDGAYLSIAQAGYSDPTGGSSAEERRIVYKNRFNFHVLEDVLYYMYNITGLIRGVSLPGEGKVGQSVVGRKYYSGSEYSAFRDIDFGARGVNPFSGGLGRLVNRATQRGIDHWKKDANACTESSSVYVPEVEEGDPVPAAWQIPYAIGESAYLEGIMHRIYHRIRTINAGEAGRALESEHMFTGFWSILDPDATGD